MVDKVAVVVLQGFGEWMLLLGFEKMYRWYGLGVSGSFLSFVYKSDAKARAWVLGSCTDCRLMRD